jgi:hypothetical protein
VANVVWSPEVFKNASPLTRAILNGYTVAPVIIIADGPHFTPGTSGNAPGTTPGGGIIGAGGTGRFPFFPRNSFNFPSNKDIDLRVSRRFRITERARLEILAEAFNLFNHINVTDLSRRLYTVGGTVAAPTLTFDPAFGTATASGNTLFRERQIQFAARFEF